MRLFSSESPYLGKVVFILVYLTREMLGYTQDEIDNAWKKMAKRKDYFKIQGEHEGCWPDKTIPFKIAAGFTEEQIQHIVNHIYQIQNKTCLNWVEKDLVKNPRKSVLFVHNKKDELDCHTKEFGDAKSEDGILVRITLGDDCFPQESVIHEMMHALGFLHEHQRLDRDCYVVLKERYADNTDFKIITDSLFEKWPYDKRSITHYTRLERFGFRDKDEPLRGLLWKYRLGDSYGPFGAIGKATGKLTCLDVHKINFRYCGAPDFCEIQPKLCREVEEDEVTQGCKDLYLDIINGKVTPSSKK